MYQLYHFSKKLDWADLARYLWAASIFGATMVIQWRWLGVVCAGPLEPGFEGLYYLVLVSATETKIRFQYRYRSLNFFYLNRNFLHFLFLMLFVPFFDYFQGHTEFSCKTFFKYLSNYHCLVNYLLNMFL